MKPCGQGQSKAGEQRGLRLVGTHHATQTDLALGVLAQREHDIGALNAREFFENAASAQQPVEKRLPLALRRSGQAWRSLSAAFFNGRLGGRGSAPCTPSQDEGSAI